MCSTGKHQPAYSRRYERILRLHTGQRIMAQVVREPFAGKPPSVSTYFSLPGRYLVLMPGVDTAGVSRKIEDAGQRDIQRRLIVIVTHELDLAGILASQIQHTDDGIGRGVDHRQLA